MPRYMIERTLPKGAIDGLDDAALKSLQSTNATFGVKWIQSYMSGDKTKTYCIYEGPNEKAVRDANAKTQVPFERIVEIPEDLKPR